MFFTDPTSPEPLDRALELFATSKDECLTYLQSLSVFEIKQLETIIIKDGVVHHAEFIAWYLMQNIASLPFVQVMGLAAYAMKKIVEGDE